jgi:hypothetical protein
MIHPQIPWQDHNGASHRRKGDTPPLVGCCSVTQVPICELRETGRLTAFELPDRNLGSYPVTPNSYFVRSLYAAARN